MKKIFLFFAIISSLLMISQTAPTIEWQKSFGGSLNDLAVSIQNTTDGGYIIAGSSRSNDGDVSENHGAVDYWIVKINSIGIIQWQNSFGGSGDDYANSIQQTTDGGYVIAGQSNSNNGDVTGNHGGIDYWIVKLDNNGNMQWQKSFGGSGDEKSRSIKQCVDGGYIIAGESFSINGDISGNHGNNDYWILKIDSNGSIQWQKSLGGSNFDYGKSAQQTNDGGYIIAGFSESNDGDVSGHHDSFDYWIVKLKSNGSIEWQKSLGGTDAEEAYSIQQTTDEGYIVSGYSTSTDGDVSKNNGLTDFWIVKLNNIGNIQWQKSLGGSDYDAADYIQQTTDGGYIVAGSSNSINGDVSGNHGVDDYWVVKLDNSGDLQWQKSLGGTKGEGAYSIQQTVDNGYIVAGYSASNDVDVIGNHGGIDYWIVKLTDVEMAIEEIQNAKTYFYPNPVKNILYFSENVFNIKITDVSGKVVKSSDNIKSINVEDLTKGLYTISASLRSGEVIVKKVIKD